MVKQVHDEMVRNRIVKGWAFRNHSQSEIDKIRLFVTTGLISYLEGTQYYELAKMHVID